MIISSIREIARISGGVEHTVRDEVFDAGLLRRRQMLDLVIPLALLLLLLHLVEIAGRRFFLFSAAEVQSGKVSRYSGSGSTLEIPYCPG